VSAGAWYGFMHVGVGWCMVCGYACGCRLVHGMWLCVWVSAGAWYGVMHVGVGWCMVCGYACRCRLVHGMWLCM